MYKIIKKLVNENNLEYLLRLCKYKIEEKPDDLDWQDIVELTDLNVHRDTLRKAMTTSFGGYAVMKHYEDKIINNVEEDFIDKLRKEREELEKMKIQFQDQKREYRKYLRLDARKEHLQGIIEKAIFDLPKFERIINFKSESDDNVEASLILSDWHLGLKCNNYWNIFNYDVAKERIEKLKLKVINYCKKHSVDTLHIEIIGDMINGSIHLGNRVEAEEDVVSQSIFASETISEFIYSISQHLNNINVYTLYGNHGRVSPNKNDSIDVENFERLIDWYMRLRLKDIDNITIYDNKFDETFGFYQLKNGNNIVFSHGNYDKIGTAISDYSQMLKMHIDEVHLGHFHNYNEKDKNGSTLVINGTLSGTDTYSKNLRLIGKPMQTLRIYGEDICAYKIYL